MKKRLILIGLISSLAVVWLAACTRSESQGTENGVFVPPTLVATVFKTPTIDPFQPTEDPRGPCDDGLTFIDDITVPDGTVFKPGEEFEKIWMVQNSGTCEWTSKYSVRLINGSAMNADDRQKLIPIAPGENGEVAVIFTAPMKVGNYYSSWQAYDAKGRPFGQDFYVEVVVSDAE